MSRESMKVEKIAVIGAGTMGGGIAAHAANLGLEVLLYDITQDVARQGLERTQGARPPHFYDHESLERVTVYGIDSDLAHLREADWVCEAIVEDMRAKRELYANIEKVLREDTLVSTNTSGLEIRELAQGWSESFRRRFLGTHFFNPPRYLKLVELIPTEETDPEIVELFAEFLEDRLGKRVVRAKDTPGFISNRFGMWVLFQAIHVTEKLGFPIEVVEAIAGPFMGRPKTAVFRLCDLIGLDVMQNIASHLRERCKTDPKISALQMPSSLAYLIESGRLGTKVGRGYYQREGSEFFVFDFNTKAYRAQLPPVIPGLEDLAKLPIGERLRKGLEQRDEIGDFLRLHLAPALEYAVEIGREISRNVEDFDRVMKWGWGWELGPFELMDEIGLDSLEKFWEKPVLREKTPFYIDSKCYNFQLSIHTERDKNPKFAGMSDFSVIRGGEGWRIREDGTGGFLFEFATKMNVITPEIVRAIIEWIETHPDSQLTLANEGRAFSAGYDLRFFLQAAEEGRFSDVEQALCDLQRAGVLLERSPSAAGLHDYSFGGGLELAMHCRMVVSIPEAILSLPEVSVGLVPAGGGCTLLRERTQGDAKAMCRAALSIALSKRFHGYEGSKSFFLREKDEVIPNPDELIYRTIHSQRVEEPEREWLPTPPMLSAMIDGESEKARQNGELGDYGAMLADEVKYIFVKSKSREDCLERERETFLRLLGKPLTIMRIKHMLETGKPLHN